MNQKEYNTHAPALRKEWEYWEANREELTAKYPGKFLVIHDDAVYKVFEGNEDLEKFVDDPLYGTALLYREIPPNDRERVYLLPGYMARSRHIA